MKVVIEENIDFIINQLGRGRYSWQGIGDFRFLSSALVHGSPDVASLHAQEACADCIVYDIEF